MNPLLSVITPLYNGEKFIAATLASIREQYIDGMELVVVDDGSTDRSLEIVRDFAATVPIRIITPGRLGNWVAVSNIGLREARGDWACFLQQDDLWLPGRIARIWSAMKAADTVLVLHDAIFIGPTGQRLGLWTCPFSEGIVPPDLFIERLLIQNFIATPSPVFRRKVVLDSGGMDESLWVCADWDLWLRLGELGPVRFIAETLSAFRIHPTSQAAARQLAENEWGEQLTTVLNRHLNRWASTERLRSSVERVARASIAVNSALSFASRGGSIRKSAVLAELLALGPIGWRRYLRDSRIVQRVSPRMKVQWLART